MIPDKGSLTPRHIKNLKEVITNIGVGLESAFAWVNSPQGHDYWSDVANGRKPFTEGDKKILESWIQAYNEQNGMTSPTPAYDKWDPKNWGVGR